MMTPKENTRKLMSGRLPERVAFHDNIWGETLVRWVGEGYPVDAHGAPVDPADHFGYDLLLTGGIDPMPFRGAETVLEESAEWVVRRNGAGAIHKYWKDKCGAPEHVGFDLSGRDVWDAQYRRRLITPDRERIAFGGLRHLFKKAREQEKFLCCHNPFLWENMRGMLGDACMLENMCLDPEWIHDYNRVYTDFYKAHYQLMFDELGCPDGISISEDMAYNKGLFCSPAKLRELFLPYTREFVDFCHAHGLTVTLHSDGDIREALPLIIEAGIDAINPLEAKANCRAVDVAGKYAGRLAFKGGLDARILESGDPSLIKKEVAVLVDGMKELGARYIFGSDHSVSPKVSYDSFRWAVETYREHMFY